MSSSSIPPSQVLGQFCPPTSSLPWSCVCGNAYPLSCWKQKSQSSFQGFLCSVEEQQPQESSDPALGCPGLQGSCLSCRVRAAGLAVRCAKANPISDIKVEECLPGAVHITLESLFLSFTQERGGKIQPMNFKLHTRHFTSDLSFMSPKILLQSLLETKYS